FFFQAEDGIRYRNVTGVQTCALPIFNARVIDTLHAIGALFHDTAAANGHIRVVKQRHARSLTGVEVEKVEPPNFVGAVIRAVPQIGRASCRERVETSTVKLTLKDTAK